MSGSKLFSKLEFDQNWNYVEFLSQDIHEHAVFKFVLALFVRPVALFFSHHFIFSISVKVSFSVFFRQK